MGRCFARCRYWQSKPSDKGRRRFSIEHGHANDQSNSYSSVAYWYQLEPQKPLPPLARAWIVGSLSFAS